MDGDASLRDSCRKAVAVARHPQRRTEHAVLDRLFYKNRNQHRRAPYFHRLDHVRRVLRQVQRHRAWPALVVATDEAQPLAFSSLTVADAEEVLALLTLATTRVVPVAARSFVTQLVSRGHFVPFGVTVIALLARLYVIERKLCVELAAAVSSMRVLLALKAGPDRPADRDTASIPSLVQHVQAGEDVGELVLAEPESTKSLCAKVESSHGALSGSACAQVCLLNRSQAKSDTPRPRRPIVSAPVGPSLYDLMVEDDPTTASAVREIGAFASPSRLPFGRPEKTPQPGVDDVSHGKSAPCLKDSLKTGKQQGLRTRTSKVEDAEKEEDDVEIDDIFAGLL